MYKSVFISDTHLGTKGCNAAALLSFLKQLQTEQLFLVGDIIDGWALRRRTYWPKEHSKIVREIIKISERVNVIYVPGNHDDFVRPFLMKSFDFGNFKIHKEYDYKTIDGRTILVTHGDKYDIWMKVPTKVINFLGHFTDWIPESEKKDQTIKRYVRSSRTEKVLRGYVQIRKKYDGVICGHTHEPKIDGIYMNTGDWKKNCSYIVETKLGEFKLKWIV